MAPGSEYISLNLVRHPDEWIAFNTFYNPFVLRKPSSISNFRLLSPKLWTSSFDKHKSLSRLLLSDNRLLAPNCWRHSNYPQPIFISFTIMKGAVAKAGAVPPSLEGHAYASFTPGQRRQITAWRHAKHLCIACGGLGHKRVDCPRVRYPDVHRSEVTVQHPSHAPATFPLSRRQVQSIFNPSTFSPSTAVKGVSWASVLKGTTDTKTLASKRKSLMTLPAEIRELVYEYFFTRPRDKSDYIGASTFVEEPVPEPLHWDCRWPDWYIRALEIPLFKVNRRIRIEAVYVFLRTMPLRLDNIGGLLYMRHY